MPQLFYRPAQGFVEVTIKRMESMLLDEVIKLRSKGLLHYYSDSAMECNEDSGTFEKKGRSLKVGDLLCDESNESASLKVIDFGYEENLRVENFILGCNYDIISPREKSVRCYRLVQIDHEFDWYHFSPHEAGVREITGGFGQLPPVYAKGCGRIDPTEILVQNESNIIICLKFDEVKDKKFRLDVSKSHVILSLG
jgi:hypothetical protein